LYSRDCPSRWDDAADGGDAVLKSSRSDHGGGAVLRSSRSDYGGGDDGGDGDGWELPPMVQVTSGDGDGGGS